MPISSMSTNIDLGACAVYTEDSCCFFNTLVCMFSLRPNPKLNGNREGERTNGGKETKERGRARKAEQRECEGLLSAFDEGLIDGPDLWESPFSGGAIQLYLPLRWLIGVLSQQC